ncbi:MAG TPA: ABC transporter permease [Chloroflexota bacterium]|nr:ABC transporter permease [Chloroflexota bacterium]
MPVSFLIRRLLLLLPMLLGVTVVAFVVSHIIPGDPAAVNLGQYAMSDPKIVAAYRHQWGLDQPLPVQFVDYLGRLLHGDMGVSQQTHRPVLTDLRDYLPATAELAITAVLISIVVGIPLGVISAVKHRRLPDHLSRLLALMGVSVPVFWLGLVALAVFYVHFSWLPGPGRLDESLNPPRTITGLFTVDSLLTGNWTDLKSSLDHLILPSVVLSGYSIGLFTRITRAAMLEVLGRHYIRTARAKGLIGWKVILRHALPNALIPTLTSVGLAFANLMTGAVLAEIVFDWPGIGRYAFQAATNLDFPAIMGVTLLIAFTYIMINLVVDILYGLVDPRIRA